MRSRKVPSPRPVPLLAPRGPGGAAVVPCSACLALPAGGRALLPAGWCSPGYFCWDSARHGSPSETNEGLGVGPGVEPGIPVLPGKDARAPPAPSTGRPSRGTTAASRVQCWRLIIIAPGSTSLPRIWLRDLQLKLVAQEEIASITWSNGTWRGTWA